MSAAGPLSNLLLAAIAFGVLYALGRPDSNTTEAIHRIAAAFLLLNLLLAVFNVIPVPPLDGASVIKGLFPGTRGFYDAIQRIPYFGIITFVALIQLLPYLFAPVYFEVAGWLPYPPIFR